MNKNKQEKNIKVNEAISNMESTNSFESLYAHKPVEFKEPVHIKDKKKENDSFS